MESNYEKIAAEITQLTDLSIIKDELACEIYDNGYINENCIYGISLNNTNMAVALFKHYGQLIDNIFGRYGINRDRKTLMLVAMKIIIRVIKETRMMMSNLQIVNNKNILYRFADPSEYDYEYGSGVIIFTLAHLYNWGLLTKSELMERSSGGKIKDITYKCRSIIYKLRSNLKKTISLREYLSVSKGVGGHIIGWQEYDIGINLRKHIRSTIGTVMGAYDAFSFDGRRPLIILQTINLNGGNLQPIMMPNGAPIVQWINISGKFSRYQEEESKVTPGIIPYQPGVLKLFKGGSTMPDPNNSEIDMVGNVDLYGIEVIADPHSSLAYELLLTAARRSNLLSKIRPPLQMIDIPALDLKQF